MEKCKRLNCGGFYIPVEDGEVCIFCDRPKMELVKAVKKIRKIGSGLHYKGGK